MSDEDDETYRVGFARPPIASRFRKGKSGNPKGRPKKAKEARSLNTEADILKRLDDDVITVGEQQYTRLELEMLTLRNSAAKGNMAAARLLDKKRIRAKQENNAAVGGVLVIPQAPSLEEWERRTAEDQRRYREGPLPRYDEEI